MRLDRLGEVDRQASLFPFCELQLTDRSLSLISTSIKVFVLIRSFPLLQDPAFAGGQPTN